ncbi:MAG TPA: PTPA-CTERM sorting domain-containing protein, partial [Casimicrobiaceae bacterium]|nr:PTPA-CTERM sorting domain-containing protein [Casimicrobiaceae bacterium]
MSFLWPEFLWLGALLPVLVGLYLLALRRKNRLALRYASLSMVRDAMGAGQRVRRH